MEYTKAKAYAYRRLTLKSQLSHELHQALIEKQTSSEDAQRIVKELIDLGYLNDTAWIEQFIRQQIQKKNGRTLIKKKLLAKGVPFSLFSPLLEQTVTSNSQNQSIERLLETKYRSKDLADSKERQKVVAALLRKGFDLELILNLMRTYGKKTT